MIYSSDRVEVISSLLPQTSWLCLSQSRLNMSKIKLCDHYTLKVGSPNKATCDLCRKEMILNSYGSDKKVQQADFWQKKIQVKLTNKYGDKRNIFKKKIIIMNLALAILFN